MASVWLGAFLSLGAGTGVFAAEPPRVQLTLAEALARISEGGRPVTIARKESELAQGDIRRARAAYWPHVQATAGRQYFAYQPSSVFGASKVYTQEKDFNFAGLGFYQMLYDFGVSSAGVKAARQLEKGAQWDVERARNSAVVEFIGAYYDVLEYEKLIVSAREEAASLARHVKDTALYYREGLVTRNELMAARAGLRAACQGLSSRRNLHRAAMARLSALLSFQDGVILVLEDAASPVTGRLNADQLQLSALMKRPELKALDEAMRASSFREEASRSSHRPVVFADGGYKYAHNMYQGRHDNWDVRLGVKVNIFDGALTEAETYKEKKRGEQLREKRKKLEDDIRTDVERAYAEWRNARENISPLRMSLARAREDLRVDRARYMDGAASSRDVLGAVSLLASSQSQLWQAEYAARRAWARLLFVMGRDVAGSFFRSDFVLEE
jgi:outer membrane protein TolC